jgi:DNA mismatch endonuclease, patch repair protein
MDILTKEKRSWNMSRILCKDTKPEKIVRSALHKSGFRFRLHAKGLIGKPDIVLPRYHAVIFVHGCFWHRHPGCKYAYTPKTRKAFWKNKFKENIDRFSLVKRKLDKLGWRVIVLWECEIKFADKLKRLTHILKKKSKQ